MQLTEIYIKRLGPFYTPITIPIDPDVTILTGSNDTGKTSVLHCLDLLFNSKTAGEMMVNQDHIQETQGKWNEDESIEVKAIFRITQKNDVGHSSYRYSSGDNAIATRAITKDSPVSIRLNSQAHGPVNWPVPLPILVRVPREDEVRDIIELTNPTPLEATLLQAAFKGGFDAGKLQAMGQLSFARAISDAEDCLNSYMARVMPMAASLRFTLQVLDASRKQVGLLLRDRHDGLTPFGNRGTGIRKMITLFAELVTRNVNAHHRIVVLDEPENSLHADAQHLLRELLFSIASKENTQVIYATHSPSMINPMRPEQVRLLRRETTNDRANSVLCPAPCDQNFFGIRSSLGLSAADSLLFGPVTVIIEGATEFLCLAPAIQKLSAINSPGFEDAKKLLSLAHFLDGMGDSFEFLCRLAKSHGTKPIILLDGDKRKAVQKQKVSEKHPTVPVLMFPEGTEFEEIVPTEIYFRALAELSGHEDSLSLLNAWKGWLEEHPPYKNKMFSKQVWEWFEESYPNIFLSKPNVMRRAIDIAKPEQINSETLRELIKAIEQQLAGTSFT